MLTRHATHTTRYRLTALALGGAVAGIPMPSAGADALPLWELRLGVAGASVPYYRGSEQTHNYTLPLPYVIYRGERVRVGDDGVKGLLVDRKTIIVDISLAAGLPARSDEHSPRVGMPELDPTLEFGPSLKVQLSRDETYNTSFWLNLPVRAMTSFDNFDPHGHGTVFAPHVDVIKQFRHVRAAFTAGPVFASRAYHSYYYDVDEQYATATRPEYHAGAGYSGTRVSFNLRQRDKTTWWGFFLRYDFLDGAVFANSPLMQQERYPVVGFVATWQLYASSTPARRAEDPLEALNR